MVEKLKQSWELESGDDFELVNCQTQKLQLPSLQESQKFIELIEEDDECEFDYLDDQIESGVLIDSGKLYNEMEDATDFEIVQQSQLAMSQRQDDFEIIRNTTLTKDFYSGQNNYQKASSKEMLYRGITYVGFHYGNRKLSKLDSLDAYLLKGSKYSTQVEWDRLIHDFRQLVWITYCKRFNPLLVDYAKFKDRPVKHLWSDNKWGCTIRCLQMLVANSLQGREDVDIKVLFDNDLKKAGFGIQNIAEVGLTQFNVYPGQWYGINQMSQVMAELCFSFKPVKNYTILTFQDGNINFNDIFLAGTANLDLPNIDNLPEGFDFGSSFDVSGSIDFGITRREKVDLQALKSEWKNQVLVIIGNRFGMKAVAQEYFPSIKRFMRLPSFTGFVGGKPGFAYYFCGFVEKQNPDDSPLDQVIFLDPHIVRASTDPLSCSEPRTLHMSELDPCLSFGFLVNSESEFNQLQIHLIEGIAESGPYSIFHIVCGADANQSIDEKQIGSISSSFFND